MNYEIYFVLRDNGIGATDAFRMAKICTGQRIAPALRDYMISHTRRPSQSMSVREDNAARRADEAYCRAYDC